MNEDEIEGLALTACATAAMLSDRMMLQEKLFKECSEIGAISGFESPMRGFIRRELDSCAEMTTFRSGNIAARLHASSQDADAPKIILAAHMDEIGFMVQSLSPDGFLLIVPIGGWWNHSLPSQRVLVHACGGTLIPGQIGSKPPHLLPLAQRTQVLSDESLFVDVGANSLEELQALGIREGCAISPDVAVQKLSIPHRWMGKAFDNRVGIYVMLEVMRRLALEAANGLKLDCELIAVGTVQEEVGTRGAKALSSDLKPDLVLVLEAPPADDTFGMPSIGRMGELSKGVQVRLYDPTHITPPALVDFVRATVESQENPIACQWAVRRTGGTDAAASYSNWGGTAAIVLGVPTRYIHSHQGIVDDRDIEACIEMTIALVKSASAASLVPLLYPLP